MSKALIALINFSTVYAFPRGAWERVRKFPSAEGCQAKPDGVVDENLLGIPTQEHGNEYKPVMHSHAGAWERVQTQAFPRRSMGTSFWFPRSRVGTSCVHSRMATHHLSFSV